MSAAAQDSASPWATWRRLLGYSSRYWPIALLAMLGMIFDAACGSVFTLIIKPMLDDLFVHKDKATIFWMPIFIVGLFLVRGMATYTAGYNMAKIARGVIQTLREEVFRKYLTLPAAFFQRESSSVQISRMTFTVEQVANASTDGLKILVLDGLMIVGQISVMLYNSARLTVALFVLAPPVAAIVWFVGRRYRRISHRIQDSVGSITGMVDEVVGGQREVRIYGGREYEQRRFATVNDAIRRLNLKIASTNSMANAVVQFVAAFALALVIFLATRPGAILREMSPGTFMSLITAMLVMLPSLKRLTTVQSNMQRGVVAAQDIFSVLDTDEERDAGTKRAERVRGEIALDGVSFAYPGAAELALRGIDLHCPAGSVTALVGRSGSGKSTLASLIPRFHDPNAGQILLDGEPLADYALDNLRAQIAWVGQQVVIFDDTVARNIAYGALGGASREAIVEAACAANALDFIDALPNGLDSRVGEGGALLSGGQRQRIAIARAILKDAPILILDEATSALDTESEWLIQAALEKLMRGRTTIVIAHRLSTVEHCDRIVVLDEGRVVDQGSHAELIGRQGLYARLHSRQFQD